MKKQIWLTILCCIILPVSTFYVSNMTSGIIGSILVILVTASAGLKFGLITAFAGFLIAFSRFTGTSSMNDVLMLSVTYFAIAIGISFTLRNQRIRNTDLEQECDELKEIKNKFDDLENKYMISLSDLTKIKEDTEKVKALSEGIVQCPCMIIITDVNGIIEYANSEVTRFTDYTLDEIIGKNAKILRYRKMDTDLYRQIWLEIRSGRTWNGEFWNKKKNGEQYWALASIAPIKNQNSNIIRYISIEYDITDKKIFELELEEARKEAIEYANFKTEILYKVSNATKLSMNEILRTIYLLVSENMNTSRREEELKRIRSFSNKILHNINNVIDFSGFIGKKIKLEFTEFDVYDTVENIVLLYKDLAKNKSINLICHIRPNVPLILIGNKVCLERILINLIDNAINNTDFGEITVFVENQSQDDDLVNIKFFISDTGKGLNAQKIEQILNNDYSLFTNTNDQDSLKLGLCVSQQIITMLNGVLNIKSKENEGSIFYFTLPFKTPNKNETDYVSYFNRFEDTDVLILEGSETYRIAFEELLGSWGINTVLINNLNEFINELDLRLEKYKLIIIGNITNDALRSYIMEKCHDSNIAKKMIVMVSSVEDALYLEEFGQIGLAAIINKPFRQYELNELICRMVKNTVEV